MAIERAKVFLPGPIAWLPTVARISYEMNAIDSVFSKKTTMKNTATRYNSFAL